MSVSGHRTAHADSGDGKASLLDDKVLWMRFKSGNDLAYSILYKRYVQRLFNYGMHTCYDRDLVKDCLQELFATLWDKREQVAEVDAVKFYLFKSFRRLLFARIQQKRRFSFFAPKEDTHSFEIHDSMEDVVILEETTAEELERLRRSIHKLTKRQREVIFLKFFNGLDNAQIAAVMELSVDSVYNLVSKAIEALRQTLRRANLLLPALFMVLE